MNDLTEQIVLALQRKNYQPLKAKALARKLGVPTPEYDRFRRALRELIKQGRAEVGKNHTIRPAQPHGAVTGVYRRMSTGTGFVRPHLVDGHAGPEIMIREGRLRNAVAKYNTIARTYLARGENDRARQILANVLEMAPLDVAVRESLIELLEQEEKWDEALDQYIDLADTHHQLGNFDKSRETYVLAERIALRVNATPDKIVRIKHRIADIDQMLSAKEKEIMQV